MPRNLLQQLEEYLSPELLRLLQAVRDTAAEQRFALYLVGGAVRDLLLDRANFDLDLVVEGDAIMLARQLAQKTGAKVVVHSRFGTARIRHEGSSLDLATARTETYSRPGALPTVCRGSIEDDLYRRDFSINAMAVRLDSGDSGKLLDCYGGEKDLEHRLVRVLHSGSFVDDATRILRALRYEQRLDFKLEPTTGELLRRDVKMLSTVSGDRIRHELELILKEEYPEKILQRAGELGVLFQIDPSLEGDGWLKQKLQQARARVCPLPLALSFSLLIYRFGQQGSERFIRQLKVPGNVSRGIRDTLRLKGALQAFDVSNLAPSEIYRLLRGYFPASILACALASDSGLVSERLQLYLDKLRYVKTLLNGEDLRRMGLPPGQRLGEVLRALHEAKLDHRVKTRKEEEDLVRSWLNKPRGG